MATTPPSPLCLAVTLLVRAGREAEALEHLRHLVAHTRREPGNLAYTVHRSLDEPRRILIYELYRDDAALEAHRNATYFAAHATDGLHRLVEARSAELYAVVDFANER